jgi:hypothetical protein
MHQHVIFKKQSQIKKINSQFKINNKIILK